MSRWIRPLLVLSGLAVVAYLVARIGPEAILSSFVTLDADGGKVLSVEAYGGA